jgi:hypothetical protein
VHALAVSSVTIDEEARVGHGARRHRIEGSLVFGDLLGKLTAPEVVGTSAAVEAASNLDRLRAQHGADGKMTDWHLEASLTAPGVSSRLQRLDKASQLFANWRNGETEGQTLGGSRNDPVDLVSPRQAGEQTASHYTGADGGRYERECPLSSARAPGYAIGAGALPADRPRRPEAGIG